MLEVGGRSLLEWNLRWVLESGFGPVWVNVHYRAAEVRAAVEHLALGQEISISAEDPIQGTAGAWRVLASEWSGTSLVVYGDNLCRFDLRAFVASHRTRMASGPTLATVALFDPQRNEHTGIAGSRVLVAGGRVTGFEEVRGGLAGDALVSTGACLLEPGIAEWMGPGFSDFGADVFPTLAAEGVLAAHVVEPGAFCLGLDTPEHFQIGRELVDRGRVRLG